MSRAINIEMAEAAVAESCRKAGVAISAIETLPSGGTHLVCITADGAAEMRHIFKRNLIDGRVKRFAFYSLRASR